MARYRPGLHFIVPIALTSLFSLALCVSVAFVLYHQQETITEDLSENLSSRKAAADLSETLADLIALLRGRADNVAPLHDRIKSHLVEIDRFARMREQHCVSAVDRRLQQLERVVAL